MLTPTVGIPQSVVASRRPKTMSQREFYSLPAKQSQTPQNQVVQDYSQTQQDNTAQQGNQVFEQAPMTGDFIAAQLDKLRNREPPPSLDPATRVKSPEAELVQPSNFQSYYEQLQTIRDASQAITGAASARNSFQQQLSSSDALGLMGGLPYTGFRTTGGSLPGKNLTKGGGGGVPSNPATNFKFAQDVAGQFGWNNPGELGAWYALGMKESGWRNTAQNPTSTAFGIGQFLDSTWGGTGIGKTSDPRQQVLAMAKYIARRYGSPSAALAFHKAHNWY